MNNLFISLAIGIYCLNVLTVARLIRREPGPSVLVNAFFLIIAPLTLLVLTFASDEETETE
jgi:hypothetical protein